MSEGVTTDNGNGRVTTADRLARIETKLDQALEEGKRSRECNDALEERVRILETGASTRQAQIENLKASVQAWNIGNTIGAGVALVLAYLGWSK